jgi:hypothetical protein
MFNNGVWVIKKLRAAIPEDPFEVLINGESMGMTKLLSFAKRVPDTSRFPQVLVLYSSGYLRLKAGADPTPPLPFGQSLVLGPAIFGTSASVRKRPYSSIPSWSGFPLTPSSSTKVTRAEC